MIALLVNWSVVNFKDVILTLKYFYILRSSWTTWTERRPRG